MKCPHCLLDMELCEKKECKQAPHWICSAFFGCNFSMPATQGEINAFKWAGVS